MAERAAPQRVAATTRKPGSGRTPRPVQPPARAAVRLNIPAQRLRARRGIRTPAPRQPTTPRPASRRAGVRVLLRARAPADFRAEAKAAAAAAAVAAET